MFSALPLQPTRTERRSQEMEGCGRELEGEETQRKAKRCLEREKGRREAVADMSEDLSEGEKGDTVSDMTTQGLILLEDYHLVEKLSNFDR
ncbi:hypothetical protein QQ045_005067 [Rhodiola kirilowii]